MIYWGMQSWCHNKSNGGEGDGKVMGRKWVLNVCSSDVMKRDWLRWSVHMERMDNGGKVKRGRDVGVKSTVGRGRLKRTYGIVVQNDL